MKTNVVQIAKNFKPALLILLVALIGVQTLNMRASAVTQTGPNRIADSKASTEAKRALANATSHDLRRIKNARVRESTLRAIAALRAIANNTSTAREAGLIANFDRAIKTLRGLRQPTAEGLQSCDDQYERCIELCKETGSNCMLCGLAQNGCYLNRLTMEMTKNPLDPTP